MRADAEWRAPERETCHDIGVRISPLAVAVALLKEVVGEDV